MGINTGSGRGGSESGGRKRRPSRRRIGRGNQIDGALLPTEESPFPHKKGFRLGVYEIIEEKDDYLVCKGFNPNAKDPFNSNTPAAHMKIDVAKPPLLMKTPWDDADPVGLRGVDYTYEYSSKDERTASWTDENDEDQEEEQTVETPYFEGDIIIAVQIRRNQVVDGLDKVNDWKPQNEDGAILKWVDLNVSGRSWRSTVRPRYLGKTISAVSKGTTANIPTYSGTVKGSESGTGESLAAYARMGAIGPAKWVFIEWIDGGWEVYCVECE